MFNLKITLGNDAMQTADDVAAALRTVIEKLEAGRTSGRIMDLNGNSVGDWDLA